jgi:uncharacterized membrane protein YccC
MTLTAGRRRTAHRVAELRAASIPIAQTAVAAGVAWWIATDALHHQSPLFAPISAIIALGLNAGYRTHRAVEMVLGVSLGVLVGDALIDAIGTGPLQMGLAVLLAMSAAVVLGGGALLASQAAISSVLVAALLPSSHGLPPPRLIDTLLGGAVGLAVLVVAPGNPTRLARRTGEPLLAGLADGLDAVAAALESRDHDAAEAALRRMRALDGPATQFREDLGRLRETAWIAPTNWYRRDAIDRLATAAPQLDHAVRNGRVLARAARRAVDLERARGAGRLGAAAGDGLPDDLRDAHERRPADLRDRAPARRRRPGDARARRRPEPLGGRAGRPGALDRARPPARGGHARGGGGAVGAPHRRGAGPVEGYPVRCAWLRKARRRCSTWWTASSTSAATWSSCSS